MLNETFNVIFKHRELNKESSGLDLLLKGSDDNCEKYHLFKRKPRRISLLLLRPVCSVGFARGDEKAVVDLSSDASWLAN